MKKEKELAFYAFIFFTSETFWPLWREVCIPIKKKKVKEKGNDTSHPAEGLPKARSCVKSILNS